MDRLGLIGGCFVAPLLVSLLLSGQWRSGRAWWLSLAATGALTATFLLKIGWLPELLSPDAVIIQLSCNWGGEFTGIVAALIVFAALPPALKTEAGLFTVPRPSSWRPVVTAAATLIGFIWAMVWLYRDAATVAPTAETLLFAATLPGVSQESSFRGVILALLVAAFGKPWRVAGIGIGWGALPVVGFVVLEHGFIAISGGGSIDWVAVAMTGIIGAGLLWLKERTGSIWVPVVVYNITNVGAQFFG